MKLNEDLMDSVQKRLSASEFQKLTVLLRSQEWTPELMGSLRVDPSKILYFPSMLEEVFAGTLIQLHGEDFAKSLFELVFEGNKRRVNYDFLKLMLMLHQAELDGISELSFENLTAIYGIEQKDV